MIEQQYDESLINISLTYDVNLTTDTKMPIGLMLNDEVDRAITIFQWFLDTLLLSRKRSEELGFYISKAEVVKTDSGWHKIIILLILTKDTKECVVQMLDKMLASVMYKNAVEAIDTSKMITDTRIDPRITAAAALTTGKLKMLENMPYQICRMIPSQRQLTKDWSDEDLHYLDRLRSYK
jgi:hypothetical protein